tara:strand:+ start:189 stop:434 length:246 start_codon:yes stop_codon:yes gene_type:complete
VLSPVPKVIPGTRPAENVYCQRTIEAERGTAMKFHNLRRRRAFDEEHNPTKKRYKMENTLKDDKKLEMRRATIVTSWPYLP